MTKEERDVAIETFRIRQGRELVALIMSWQMGVKFQTALKDIPPDVRYRYWEMVAKRIQGEFAERAFGRPEDDLAKAVPKGRA